MIGTKTDSRPEFWYSTASESDCSYNLTVELTKLEARGTGAL